MLNRLTPLPEKAFELPEITPPPGAGNDVRRYAAI